MHRIGVRRARAGRAGALALVLAFAAAVAHAATEAATALVAPPRPPHQVTPDAPLFPDYYALALAHTSIKDDSTWRPLHLHAPPGHATPAFIVLPVQTQAYGFAPTFRALLGARLDQELQRRHVDATRQTDIVDWRGPFVRRSDDATLASFATEHVGETLLTLYLGHDADSHAFLTLGRNDAGKVRLAHRRVDIPQGELPTLNALAAELPVLLAELGLGDAKPAPALAPGRSGGCEKADWNLSDLPPSAPPVATACHALLMGTLMPDFLSLVADLTQPSAPDRLAWLARAWVEAAPLAAQIPAMRSAATLASLQLRLDADLENAGTLADDPDAVVRPLARMLWSRQRAASRPQRSRNDTSDDYVSKAVDGLPAFAAALVKEHAAFNQEFRRIDLCSAQLALPYFRVPAGCGVEAQPGIRTTGTATHGQLQLLDDWRLAAAWSGLYIEGRMRGSASGLEAVLHDMPPRIATHPLIRTMHFAVQATEVPAVGIDAHLARTRSRVLDYAQAIATLQRDDVLIRNHDAIQNTEVLASERTDAVIIRVQDDLWRIGSVESYDFHSAILWRPQRDPALPAAFLADGSFATANSPAQTGTMAPPSGAHPQSASSAAAPSASSVSHFSLTRPTGDWRHVPALPARAELERSLARNPSDMSLRTALALVALEHGEGVTEARRLIDARASHQQAEDAIRESNDWAEAAHMFYFAGELDAARVYYGRAASTEVGSESDLISRVRLAAIDGDLHGALVQSRERRLRYRSEWAAADEAGYLFMLKRPEEAWRIILPQLQTSQEPALWRSALAGHRIAGDVLAALPNWLLSNRLERATNANWVMAPIWMRHYALLDRLPTQADIELLQTRPQPDKPSFSSQGAAVVKTAIDGAPISGRYTLDADMMGATSSDYLLLMPFYDWALWNATGGKDPLLDQFRKAPLEAGFQFVLSKAMVLAADGQRAQALRFLTAARYELGRNGGANPVDDALRAAPYEFVLATWLMSRKTGESAYAEQGLAIARAYQHVVEYMGWPYAGEALLGHDPAARMLAACRALALDPGSMFLHESGLHPDPKSAVCRKATAW